MKKNKEEKKEEEEKEEGEEEQRDRESRVKRKSEKEDQRYTRAQQTYVCRSAVGGLARRACPRRQACMRHSVYPSTIAYHKRHKQEP